MDNWLSKIESRHKYDESWIPSKTETIYDQILDDANADRGHMIPVLREFAQVSIWAGKLLEAMDEDSPTRVTLVGLRMGKLRILLSNLSSHAKALAVPTPANV